MLLTRLKFASSEHHLSSVLSTDTKSHCAEQRQIYTRDRLTFVGLTLTSLVSSKTHKLAAKSHESSVGNHLHADVIGRPLLLLSAETHETLGVGLMFHANLLICTSRPCTTTRTKQGRNFGPKSGGDQGRGT